MAKYLNLAGLAHLLEILDNRYLAPQNSLKSITLEKAVTIKGEYFLNFGFYESISLPNCQYLGWGALQENKYLTQVNLPKLELKWDKDAKTAIQQIKEKNYAGTLKNFAGRIIFVGINYDKKNRKYECKIE